MHEEPLATISWARSGPSSLTTSARSRLQLHEVRLRAVQEADLRRVRRGLGPQDQDDLPDRLEDEEAPAEEGDHEEEVDVEEKVDVCLTSQLAAPTATVSQRWDGGTAGQPEAPVR